MGINFQDVKFAYYIPRNKKKTRYQLTDVNLNISAENEFIGIVGHTGSGKSTLVQLMNALNRPTYGSVEVLGHKVTRKNKTLLKPIRQNVGLVFQFPEYQLFEQTSLEDIMFGPKNFGFTKEEAEKNALEAAKIVGLNEELLEKNPFTLSGGEMRKVAISGILASKPKILIFDEPTVGLDPRTKSELMNLLLNLNKMGKTIIIVTHDMEVVSRYCDRVIVLEEGKIALDLPKKELFSKKELLDRYSLDYPVLMKLLQRIKDQYNVDIDVNKFTLEDAYLEIRKVLGKSHG